MLCVFTRVGDVRVRVSSICIVKQHRQKWRTAHSLQIPSPWWELDHTEPGRLQHRVFTSSTQLPKKLKWENTSPASQHIPQYSTGGSRSILLEEMKSQREIVFALRESRIRGREIWAKIPNLANKLSMKGRKRKTDLEEMYKKVV